jgi:hypothetical protein
VAVVGDVGDELVLAVRQCGAARLTFVPEEALRADAPPDELRADFDIALVGVSAESDDHQVEAAQALLGPRGQTVVVGRAAAESVSLGDANGAASAEVEALHARIADLERRRAAVLVELVSCEAQLSRSTELADAVHTEILMMRRTVSWRITSPLRWMRARARSR